MPNIGDSGKYVTAMVRFVKIGKLGKPVRVRCG
jgi:hypothetical protein